MEPVWVNARHRFRVVNVVREADDWVSIYVTGRRLGTLDVQAGQYFRWRFLHPGCWWQAHPFSLSAPPNPDWLQDLTPGTRVLLSGPHGAFTPDRRTRDRVLLIAAGGGIAPIRALVARMPPDTVLIYRTSTENDLIFRHELDAIAAERGVRVVHVVGSRNDP